MRHPDSHRHAPPLTRATTAPMARVLAGLRSPARQSAESEQPPTLWLFEDALQASLAACRAVLPGVALHYAVKANPHPPLLASLHRAGARFEIASVAELEALRAIAVQLPTVLFSNPIKSPPAVRAAARAGLRWFSVDSVEEVHKIAHCAPGAHLCLRLAVDNGAAVFPLAHKFGAELDAVPALIRAARQGGATIAGVGFHVGSHCLRPAAWTRAIEHSRAVIEQLEAAGQRVELLDLGGGYPAPIGAGSTALAAIGAAIERALRPLPPTVRVVAEPGRALVASCGVLQCRVNGTAQRRDGRWAYLDAGYYSGLMELGEGYRQPLACSRGGPLVDWTLAGPTCDSIDAMGAGHRLPAALCAGDTVLIGAAGAYLVDVGTHFNGFAPPAVRWVADE